MGALGYFGWAHFGAQPEQATSSPATATATTRENVPVASSWADDYGEPRLAATPTPEDCSVIHRVPVESSAVRSVGYCPAKRTLEVELVRGAVYRYWGVSQGTYNAFLAAPSKGQFFNVAIRGQPYGYVQVR